MTLQTLVVLVIGAAYGWRLGGATVALYLAEGLAGLPVFAGPVAGPAYMAGPTGGFLVGFLAAAMATGFMAERGWDRSLLSVIAMMALGHAVIFAFGLGWLATLMPARQGLGGRRRAVRGRDPPQDRARGRPHAGGLERRGAARRGALRNAASALAGG